MDSQRDRLVLSLGEICIYLEEISASSNILTNAYELLKANTSYDPANARMVWQPVNNRYEEALLGERNSFVYIAHVLATEPAWVGVEILTSKQDQCDNALDIVVDGRKDQPETEQCKTGHLGKSGDLYAHKGWLKGTPDNVVAVCIERGVIYGGPLSVWKRVYREGSSAIDDDSKWMYVSEFKANGGWVVDIHEDVKKLIPLEETSE